jgi:hypothetical protein
VRGRRIGDVVLALLLVAVLCVSTRTEVAAFLTGLVLGLGLACSLPFVTRWAEGLASRTPDDEGGGVGGVTQSRPFVNSPPGYVPPSSLGRLIGICTACGAEVTATGHRCPSTLPSGLREATTPEAAERIRREQSHLTTAALSSLNRHASAVRHACAAAGVPDSYLPPDRAKAH